MCLVLVQQQRQLIAQPHAAVCLAPDRQEWNFAQPQPFGRTLPDGEWTSSAAKPRGCPAAIYRRRPAFHDVQKRDASDERARAPRLNKGRGDPLVPGPCTMLL
ncbi:hypothetical protein PSPO01_06968 [Paraphaeosphaeria sporulosa]